VSFAVTRVVKNGWFNNRVEIEALDNVVVERVKFRNNAVGMFVIGSHGELRFNRGDTASICVPKKVDVGSTLSVGQVSQAVSAHRWQWLAR
jgi:hypothetical protein